MKPYHTLLLLTIILPLLVLTSCGSARFASKFGDSENDTFSEESFLRYTKSNLDKLENTPYKNLAQCHSGHYKAGLLALKLKSHDHKKDPEYWNQVGMCYFLAQSYSKAEFYFDLSNSVATNNQYPPAMNNLGVLKLKRNFYDEALEYFTKAQGKKLERKVPLYNQAQIYLQFNLFNQAGIILQKLNDLGHNDPDILISLSSVYLFKGHTDDAYDLLNRIPEESRSREDFVLYYTTALYERKEYFKVKEILDNYNFIKNVEMKKSARVLASLNQNEIKNIEIKNKKIEIENKKNAKATTSRTQE